MTPPQKLRWDNWSRPDGTKTTWHSSDDSDIDVSSWDKLRKEELQQIASKSLAVVVQSTTDFHNAATYERHQAVSQKLAMSNKNPPNQVEEMMLLMEYHKRMDNMAAGDPLESSTGTTSIPSVRTSKRLNSQPRSVVQSLSAGSSRSPSVLSTPSLKKPVTPKRRRIMRSEEPVVTNDPDTDSSGSLPDVEPDLCQLRCCNISTFILNA